MKLRELIGVAVFASCVFGSPSDIANACKDIANKISNASALFYPGTPAYASDIKHFVESSSQDATCSVEPGTPEDVAVILKVIGAKRVPFAVKGGGHAINPKFSSTTGVQIALSRFSGIDYDASAQTVTIGAGVIWIDVYTALDKFGVYAVGGRNPTVGVSGFTLGGGYSWKSNQRGLASDTAVAYELVTPEGVVRTVTAKDKDLFWALKGGGNKLGVVTRITLKTFPQGQVWGGIMVIPGDQFPALKAAILKFNQVRDPLAQVVPTLNVIAGSANAYLLMVYDAPNPPPGIFDDFLAIPSLKKDVQTRSFLEYMLSTSGGVFPPRAIADVVTVPDYTPGLVDLVFNETFTQSQALPQDGSFITYVIEPFIPDYLNNPNRTSDSAFPPRRKGFPLNLSYGWTSAADDKVFHDTMRNSTARIQAYADAEAFKAGHFEDIALPRYPNYAIYDTPNEAMFGIAGTARLRAIARSVDPKRVMNLAGAYKL